MKAPRLHADVSEVNEVRRTAAAAHAWVEHVLNEIIIPNDMDDVLPQLRLMILLIVIRHSEMRLLATFSYNTIEKKKDVATKK